MLAPTVIAHTIVEAVSEHEATFAHIEIHGQARKRIVGNGITRRNRGEYATRSVEKEQSDIGCEKVLIHISHAKKQMRPLPLVHIAQHSNRRSGVFLLNVGKTLPVVDNGLVGAQHVERGSLNRTCAIPQRNAQVQPQLVCPIHFLLHVPVQFRSQLATKALPMRKNRTNTP